MLKIWAGYSDYYTLMVIILMVKRADLVFLNSLLQKCIRPYVLTGPLWEALTTSGTVGWGTVGWSDCSNDNHYMMAQYIRWTINTDNYKMIAVDLCKRQTLDVHLRAKQPLVFTFFANYCEKIIIFST